MLDRHHLLRISLVVMALLGLVSCQGFFTDPALTSITVTPSSPNVVVGGTQQFTATGVNDDGSGDTLSNVTWSSGTQATATINSSGLATAVAAGTTTITATSGSISGSTTLTVNTSALQSISITATTNTVLTGSNLQLTATARFADGSTRDITSSAGWQSSNTSVATVSSSGLVRGVAAGTVTITATSGSVSSQFTVTVT